MKHTLTTVAKVARSVVRVHGLFCKSSSCLPGQPLEASREIDGLLFRFSAVAQLTEKELEVLLALLAIACKTEYTYKKVRQWSGGNASDRARKMLAMGRVEVRTSYSGLARELGRSTGGDTWTFITEALTRLFTVSAFIKPADQTNWHRFNAGHLLEALSIDEQSETVAVSLSPAIAYAILGGPGEFVNISMGEVRVLRTDKSGVARLLHLYLHGMPAGKKCQVSEDTLMTWVHGVSPSEGSTRRMRIKSIRDAMIRLGDLEGWSTSRNTTTHFIVRPNRTKRVGV